MRSSQNTVASAGSFDIHRWSVLQPRICVLELNTSLTVFSRLVCGRIANDHSPGASCQL